MTAPAAMKYSIKNHLQKWSNLGFVCNFGFYTSKNFSKSPEAQANMQSDPLTKYNFCYSIIYNHHENKEKITMQ